MTRRFEKIAQFFKSSPKSLQGKKGQYIYNTAQFESPKHLHQTTFKPKNTYNKPYFETAYLGENVINLLQQKVAQNIAISSGYFIFSKNHNEPPKVAQLAKKSPSLVALFHVYIMLL